MTRLEATYQNEQSKKDVENMNKLEQAPVKMEALKEQARKQLKEHGFIVDGSFEGNFET